GERTETGSVPAEIGEEHMVWLLIIADALSIPALVVLIWLNGVRFRTFVEAEAIRLWATPALAPIPPQQDDALPAPGRRYLELALGLRAAPVKAVRLLGREGSVGAQAMVRRNGGLPDRERAPGPAPHGGDLGAPDRPVSVRAIHGRAHRVRPGGAVLAP